MKTGVKLSIWILIAIWSVSFAFCILAVVVARNDIPKLFHEAIKTMFDTFATPLAAILGFVFSLKSDDHKKKSRFASPRGRDAFAIIVTLFYCGVFDYFVVLFVAHQATMKSVIDAFSDIRPYLAFLITGIIAFYFGASKEVSV
jgi:hypothetical protein